MGGRGALQGGARRLVSRTRAAGARTYRALGERFDLEAIKRGPASVIPEVPAYGDPSWNRRSEVPGLEFDLDQQVTLLYSALRHYIEEFASEVRGGGFELWNGLYQAGDAEALYALVRHLKPSRILEIGSGYSTVVSGMACTANKAEGHDTRLVAVDPDPRIGLDHVTGLTACERMDCRALGMERYRELEAGDILFIDTTHVVKLGGEVNWLVLEVLPRLRPGVWVHIHDIYLPYEYPWYVIHLGGYYSEQYLVHAFLTGNAGWEVMLALAALYRDRYQAVTELIPSLTEQVPGVPEVKTWLPAAFWVRRAPQA